MKDWPTERDKEVQNSTELVFETLIVGSLIASGYITVLVTAISWFFNWL